MPCPMLFPVGDTPNPQRAPWVTYALMLANVAVFVLLAVPLSNLPADPDDPLLAGYVEVILGPAPDAALRQQVLAQLTAYDLFLFEHGFRPVAPSLTALFGSLFLHAGILHLLGNLLFLWIYGDNVENRLGRPAFLGAYLATGVAATLFQTLTDLDSALPLVGASGAISGILGFYFVWFPRNRVRLFLVLPPFVFRTLQVPARFVLTIYLLVDNLLPFLLERAGAGGGVAHGAHIGGFIAGLAGAWMLGRRPAAPPLG